MPAFLFSNWFALRGNGIPSGMPEGLSFSSVGKKPRSVF